MLTFITFKDAPEQIEIVGDESGLEDLINYLKYVMEKKDHFHLNIDNELNPYPIGKERLGKTLFAKHVKLEFCQTEIWENL